LDIKRCAQENTKGESPLNKNYLYLDTVIKCCNQIRIGVKIDSINRPVLHNASFGKLAKTAVIIGITKV